MPNPWIPYEGSGMPVEGGVGVLIRCRGATDTTGIVRSAANIIWHHTGAACDVVAYRLADADKD